MKIEEMEAGRELDKLIAEQVFGIKKVFRPCDVSKDCCYDWNKDYHYIPAGKPARTHMIDARPVPSFSTSIAAAWKLVEHWKQQGNMVSINGSSDSGWWCVFYLDATSGGFVETGTLPTVPLAICHAALLAVNKEIGKRETSASSTLS